MIISLWLHYQYIREKSVNKFTVNSLYELMNTKMYLTLWLTLIIGALSQLCCAGYSASCFKYGLIKKIPGDSCKDIYDKICTAVKTLVTTMSIQL